MFCLHYVSVVYVPGPHRNQKRASGLLKLELQVFLNHHVVFGNQTWVLCKSNMCSDLKNYTIYNFFTVRTILSKGKGEHDPQNQILIYSFPLALCRCSMLCSYDLFSPFLPIHKASRKPSFPDLSRWIPCLQNKSMSFGIRQP